MTYPKILTTKNSINVEVCPYELEFLEKQVEFILDYNKFQDIIGIEILDIKFEAGDSCLGQIKEKVNTTRGANISYSYDEESDSFYLVLADDRSLDQEAVLGSLNFNAKGEIIRFSWNRVP